MMGGSGGGGTGRGRRAVRAVAVFAVLSVLVGGCETGGDEAVPARTPPQRPTPSAPPPPDPCDGEGWDTVAPLALAEGPVSGLFAVATAADGTMITSVAGGERLHVRVTSDPAVGPPDLFLDVDGHRGTGAWTFGSAVSSAGWDLRVDGSGRILRHDGRPDEWSWAPIDAGRDYRWSARDGETVVCLPLDVLGRTPERLGLGASIAEQWLPRPFLPAVAYPRTPIDPPGDVVRVPGRLAIAYAFRPWVVRDCTDAEPVTMDCASDAYAAFDHVVLAAGLEDPDHPSHSGTARLIDRLRDDHPSQEVWGYISLRSHAGRQQGPPDVAARAAAWAQMGVTGIFLDEADLCPDGDGCPNGGVSRATQVAVVDATHELGLAVFANGFHAPEVLDTVDGVPTPLGAGSADRPPDMYLLENPTVAGGDWKTLVELDASTARIDAAIRLSARSGVRLAAVDTAAGWVDDDADGSTEYLAGWWRAVQAGVEAYGFTNPLYSAPDEFGPNLAVLDPPPEAELLDGLRFASRSLRLAGFGRRITRDVLDCHGEPAGTLVVEVTDAAGTIAPRLVLPGDLPDCP